MCVAARTCRSSSCTLKGSIEELRADLILVVEDVRETSDGIEMRPDSLNQLRGLLARLLTRAPGGAMSSTQNEL